MAGMNVQINAKRGLKRTGFFTVSGKALEHAASSWVCLGRPRFRHHALSAKRPQHGGLCPLLAALHKMMRMRCVLHALHYRKIAEALCSGEVKVSVHFGFAAGTLTD
ncbi:hypothetical protein [Desulfovibrio sp.]|uniref:hypothetical protein n=1 Tax=Desulfovibrio sp. TaxID=885 RepID=UPI0025B916BD|nr:hypothetical protein [Desulfovibrio sp.]